jgi:hypothetical protein
VISRDPAEAERLVSAGAAVVLILSPGDEAIGQPAGPGRLAVLVADPAEPGSGAAAAAEMAVELFGA